MPSRRYHSNTTPSSKIDTKSSRIYLRREFEQILREFGHFVVLRNFLREKPRLDSFDELYEEADKDALQRLSAGRVYVDHITLARRRTVVPAFESTAPVGSVETRGDFFYLPTIMMPNKEDWIIEIALDDSASPITPYKITNFFNIMSVEPERDTNGAIAYWRVRVEMRSISGHD